MDVTTLKIQRSSKERLDKFRIYRRESYDEIIQKLLEILNTCRQSPERARARLVSLEKQRRQNSKQLRAVPRSIPLHTKPKQETI